MDIDSKGGAAVRACARRWERLGRSQLGKEGDICDALYNKEFKKTNQQKNKKRKENTKLNEISQSERPHIA